MSNCFVVTLTLILIHLRIPVILLCCYLWHLIFILTYISFSSWLLLDAELLYANVKLHSYVMSFTSNKKMDIFVFKCDSSSSAVSAAAEMYC